MVSGRQAPLPGIDRMIAPLISAVPVRVTIGPGETVSKLLSDIQKQSIAMIAYEQTELLDIRRINTETDLGTRFNTLLVVNPPEENDYMDEGPFQHQTGYVSNRNGLDDFNPNALMIMCQLTRTNDLHLELSFDSKVIGVNNVERIAGQFEYVLRQINTSTSQLVGDVSLTSEQDIIDIWKWNVSLPSATSECVHGLIGETVKQQPSAPAICAWDGNLSYSELESLSNRVASHLAALGAGPGDIIPLYFEKSMWFPVAALGAMKTGAACLAMDSTQPESRSKSIAEQVDPKFLLSSNANQAMAGRLSTAKVVVIDHNHTLQFAEPTPHPSPVACPSDVLYVVFTSGSTGVPKGIVTTHKNFASAATHQAEVLQIKSGTRVFDFPSYAFDVSWSQCLQTLIYGGCLCIPSEWERRNNIAGAFNRMNCDYIYLTPSVAQSLEPSTLPELRTLTMGGEPIQSKEVARWTQAESIIGIYGPAECAQALSFVRLDATARNNHVGHSFGANTWLVEPGRPDRLAAIGTIAELAIEGPTVSKGYYGDLNRTAQAYIQDPSWLSNAPLGHQGRKGTVYVTGDLLRYNPDGSLDFIGRKDGMVKLRGQRIELAEVEYHVSSSIRVPALCDGIAAEIITPKNSTRPLLAVFFSLSQGEGHSESKGDTQAKVSQVVDGLEERLRDRVPQYMVPSAYIHIERIPMTTTSKTDRRSLRNLGSNMTIEQLAKLQSSGKARREPSTVMERRLQSLWASVLDLELDSIGLESSFLRIGGESIAAMRLVSKARDERLSLTVGDIFKVPRLAQQALLVTEIVAEESVLSQPPFSLLGVGISGEFIKEFVAPVIGTNQGTVKDVVPATDFQSLSIVQALQDPPGRLPHWIFDLPADVDFPRLKQACMKLINYFDILHTVFIQANERFWQVLLSNFQPVYDELDAMDEDISVFTDSTCAHDLERPRQLGRSFMRLVAIKHRSGAHKLVFRISHAQFDGFSWGIVLQTLSSIYLGKPLPSMLNFSQYIGYNETKKADNIRYWASRLHQSSHPRWSSSDPTNRVHGSEHRLTIKESIPMGNALQHEEISNATIFHAACAVALSRQFKQREVIFGRLVTGRSMLPGRLQNVVGPTLTELPVRVITGENANLAAIALQLQDQFIEDAKHEALGMAEIIKNCTDWPDDAQDFGWRTSFQQDEDVHFTFLGAPSSIGFYKRDMPPRSRPEIYATPKGGTWDIELEANTMLISEASIKEFLVELRAVLREF